MPRRRRSQSLRAIPVEPPTPPRFNPPRTRTEVVRLLAELMLEALRPATCREEDADDVEADA